MKSSSEGQPSSSSRSSSGSDCDTENKTSYEGSRSRNSSRSPAPELHCAVDYPAANTLKLRSNSYQGGATVSSMEYCYVDNAKKSTAKYCDFRKLAISDVDSEDYTLAGGSRSRNKPAQEYDSVFDVTRPKQEYTSTVVTPKFVDMFSSPKQVELETRIPLTPNEAIYAKRTIELRGTVTAVAEQLSASRQMEKKLKLRLEHAYNDIEELEDDKYKLKQNLRTAVINLDMAEERIKERDDIIVKKEMELFVIRNTVELLRRSKRKAEEENDELVAKLDKHKRAYDKMSTSSWKKETYLEPRPNFFPKTHVPKIMKSNSVGRKFPNYPYRYHYFAPNYNPSKMKSAVSGTNGTRQLSSTLESTSNSLKHESTDSQTQSSLTEQALERPTSSLSPKEVKKSSISTETDYIPSSRYINLTECGSEESLPNSRPESPFELEIRADYDDDFNFPNTPCKKVVRHDSI